VIVTEPPRIGVVVSRCFGGRRDAVDGDHDHLVESLGFRALGIRQRTEPAKHLDLEIVERIDVGVAQMHGPLDSRVPSMSSQWPVASRIVARARAYSPSMRAKTAEARPRSGTRSE